MCTWTCMSRHMGIPLTCPGPSWEANHHIYSWNKLQPLPLSSNAYYIYLYIYPMWAWWCIVLHVLFPQLDGSCLLYDSIQCGPAPTSYIFLTCSQVGHWTSGDSRALHIRATYRTAYMALYCSNDRRCVQESGQFPGRWPTWSLHPQPAVESHPAGWCRKHPCTHR